MPAVGHDRPILHRGEVYLVEDASVPGDGDEYVPDLRCLRDGHHRVAIHDCLQSRDGLDLGHDDMGSQTTCPHRYPPAAPAIAADHHPLSGPQDIGGSGNAVDGALAGAIAVIKEVLRIRLVHSYDGVEELPLLSQAPQPDTTGGSLFSASDNIADEFLAIFMNCAHQVSAIVQGDMGSMFQGSINVLVIGFVVLPIYGIDRDAILCHQGRSDIVLGREGV